MLAEASTELKKRFSAVCRAMKSRLVRRELTICLSKWKEDVIIDPTSDSKYCLSNIQFEYIVRLSESALTNSTGRKATQTFPLDFNIISACGCSTSNITFILFFVKIPSLWAC